MTWIVNVLGKPQTGFPTEIGEISVVRQINHLGQASFGWYGADKVLIATGSLIPRVWEKHLQTAAAVAAELNEFDAS